MFNGSLLMFAIFGIFVTLIVILVGWVNNKNSRTSERRDRSPILLKERFAKGEIDGAELTDQKRQLQG